MSLITAYPTTSPEASPDHRPDRPPPTGDHPGGRRRDRGHGLRGREHGHLRRLRPGAGRPSCPLFIGLVVVLSFLLLAMVFRSLVIPLTAAVMNLLSIGAAFGVLVAVFQWGWLGSVFQVGSPGPIEAFLPVMLFAILFGLSMDYEVFLISRIHEECVKSGDNATAVRKGLAATGKTITAAALIMILVFGSFILGGELVIKEFGLGLAGRHPHGRRADPHGHRPRADVHVRQGQLVVPGLARPDPPPPVGRPRAARPPTEPGGPTAPAEPEPVPV